MSRLARYAAALTPAIALEMREARERGFGRHEWRFAQAAGLDLLPSTDQLQGGLVIDLGANVGAWTSDLLGAVPTASVVCVEPSEGPRAALEHRFAGDDRVTILPFAVADQPGTAEFHVTAHSHNASLQMPRVEMNDQYGHGWDTTTTVQVPVTTVDEIAAGRDVALLKIDVQGAERLVLEGAKETLPRTGAVLLEVTFISHYEGDAGFPWLHERMAELGFELGGLSKPFLSKRRTALWCDACYVRRPSQG